MDEPLPQENSEELSGGRETQQDESASCGGFTLQVLLLFLSQDAALGIRLMQWSGFSKKAGIGPLALALIPGSVDGQCCSPLHMVRNGNCLCVSGSASLQSAQTARLLFLFCLSLSQPTVLFCAS